MRAHSNVIGGGISPPFWQNVRIVHVIKSSAKMNTAAQDDRLNCMFTWRSAVNSAYGPPHPTTRHVLTVLSLHMTELGESCFPSTARLAMETALAQRTVIKHLAQAEADGWIQKSLLKITGQGWRRHQYHPQLPARIREALGSSASPQGDVARAAPLPQADDPGAPACIERGDPKGKKVVHQDHLRSSMSTSVIKHTSSRKKRPVLLRTYLQGCQQQAVEPIPESDPVFKYIAEINLPREFLDICWREFVERHIDMSKKYQDWRQAFRNCVRGNWYHLWWVSGHGDYQLTTTGQQARLKHRSAA